MVILWLNIWKVPKFPWSKQIPEQHLNIYYWLYKTKCLEEANLLLFHSGTNDLTDCINTRTKVRKVVAIVEEMEKEN